MKLTEMNTLLQSVIASDLHIRMPPEIREKLLLLGAKSSKPCCACFFKGVLRKRDQFTFLMFSRREIRTVLCQADSISLFDFDFISLLYTLFIRNKFPLHRFG